MINENGAQSCYFVNCLVNGQSTTDYVDTGCSVVTIRKSDASKMGLPYTTTAMLLHGYGGGMVKALGRTEVTLCVDLFEAQVDALVVGDEVQQVPVLIGQLFIHKACVILVVKDNKLRLFAEDLAQLPEVEELPPAKVNLRSKATVVLLPHSIGFV